MSIEESFRGRLSAIARQVRGGPRLILAYQAMRDDMNAYGDFPFIAYDAAADARFQQMTHLATKIGVRDLRIAAIALASNLTVLTGNTRDFVVVPGLTIADWTV